MRRRAKVPPRPPSSRGSDRASDRPSDRYSDRMPEQSSSKSSFFAAINYGTIAVMSAILILGIGLGIAFSSTANFSPENVASREVIDRSVPNAELCAQYGASAITMDTRAYMTLNPFSVYISRPTMQPGCVLRSSNWSILEKANLVTSQEVNECRKRLNTFGFTGDVERGDGNVKVSCIYQNDASQNLFLDQTGAGGTPRESDRF